MSKIYSTNPDQFKEEPKGFLQTLFEALPRVEEFPVPNNPPEESVEDIFLSAKEEEYTLESTPSVIYGPHVKIKGPSNFYISLEYTIGSSIVMNKELKEPHILTEVVTVVHYKFPFAWGLELIDNFKELLPPQCSEVMVKSRAINKKGQNAPHMIIEAVYPKYIDLLNAKMYFKTLRKIVILPKTKKK